MSVQWKQHMFSLSCENNIQFQYLYIKGIAKLTSTTGNLCGHKYLIIDEGKWFQVYACVQDRRS